MAQANDECNDDDEEEDDDECKDDYDELGEHGLVTLWVSPEATIVVVASLWKTPEAFSSLSFIKIEYLYKLQNVFVQIVKSCCSCRLFVKNSWSIFVYF